MDETTKLQINMAELQKDIKYIKESLDSHIQKEQETIDAMRTDMKDFLKEANNMFASKKTEVIVYGCVALILIGFATIWINRTLSPEQTLTASEVQKMIDNSRDEYLIKDKQ